MADWDYINTPEWYERLKKEQGCGQNQIPHYEEITLGEFCGRFNLTPEKASWEIKSRKLWGYDRYHSISLHGPMIPGEYHLPEPEADRYAAILEAEKQQPEQLQTKKRRNPDNPKSQNTLLQMIAVMAIKGYKYNPDDSRSTVPATIVNSAQSMGITLDPKTVREWLQQAAEYGSSEE